MSTVETNDQANRACPEGAVLFIGGERFPCDTMRQMVEGSTSHEGWPHGSLAAEAVWGSGPARPDVETFSEGAEWGWHCLTCPAEGYTETPKQAEAAAAVHEHAQPTPHRPAGYSSHGHHGHYEFRCSCGWKSTPRTTYASGRAALAEHAALTERAQAAMRRGHGLNCEDINQDGPAICVCEHAALALEMAQARGE